MNISGIRPKEEFYKYNEIQQNEQRCQIIQEHEKEREREQLQAMAPKEGEDKKQEMSAQEHAQRQRYVTMDFAMRGNDSRLEDLDMQQAISDMKKDAVLQQYQFFVGESRELEKKLLSVRPLEDFTL